MNPVALLLSLCSPTFSPYKWLSPHTCRRLFGRPRVKAEKLVLNYRFESSTNFIEEKAVFKKKIMSSPNKNFSILQPLMQNYHVLRHPAIQKEVEERAAAEARLLSDETGNTIEKQVQMSEHCEIDNNYANGSIERTASSGSLEESRVIDNVVNPKASTKLLNRLETNVDSLVESDIKGCETITDKQSNLVAAPAPTVLIPQNKTQLRFVPTGSIKVRKCYIPRLNNKNESLQNNMCNNKKTCEPVHMKCSRPQPGTKWMARLEKQEKTRKLATLALFGHTFRRPEIIGVRPHAVSVQGFKRYHLKILSKLSSDMLDSNGSSSYNNFRAISRKNRKTKFPRICLTGTASELLAGSPQCTESSDSSDEDDFSNNNTQKPFQRIEQISKSNKHSKTNKSKSLISSLSNSNKSKPIENENEFPCHYCDRSFTTKSGVGWHESYAHPRKCRVCSKSFQFSNRWSRHKDPICNPCSEKFPQPKNSPMKITPTLSQTYNPQQLTEKQRLYYRFKCDICNKLFGKRGRMIKHITNNHPSDMHKVDLSKFVFSPKKPNNAGRSSLSFGQTSTSRKNTPSSKMEQ